MSNPPHQQSSGPHQRAPNISAANQNANAGMNSNNQRYSNNNYRIPYHQPHAQYYNHMQNTHIFMPAAQYTYTPSPPPHMVYFPNQPGATNQVVSHMSSNSGTNISVPTGGIDQAQNTVPSNAAQISNVPPSNVMKPREKVTAILRDPTTNKIVPLDDLVVKEPTPNSNVNNSTSTTSGTDARNASDHKANASLSTGPANNKNKSPSTDSKSSSNQHSTPSLKLTDSKINTTKDTNASKGSTALNSKASPNVAPPAKSSSQDQVDSGNVAHQFNRQVVQKFMEDDDKDLSNKPHQKDNLNSKPLNSNKKLLTSTENSVDNTTKDTSKEIAVSNSKVNSKDKVKSTDKDKKSDDDKENHKSQTDSHKPVVTPTADARPNSSEPSKNGHDSDIKINSNSQDQQQVNERHKNHDISDSDKVSVIVECDLKTETKPSDDSVEKISVDNNKSTKNEERLEPSPDQKEETNSNTTEATADKPKSEVGSTPEPPQEEQDDSNKANDDRQKRPELKYELDQYNPKTNPNGKKKYTIEFMKQIFEMLNIISMKPSNPAHGSKLPQHDAFAVPYSNQFRGYSAARQNEPMRRQSQHAYAGRGSMGQEKQRKVISSVSLTQEVELRTTNSPWKPMKEVTKEGVADEEVETIKLMKQFRGILNKLTPNNFDSLSKSVKDLPINTESRLEQVIGIVFAKAIAEPGFCVLYGRMCKLLRSDQVKGASGESKFGGVLLKKCQEQFQADIYAGIDINGRKKKAEEEEDSVVKKQIEEELYEDMFKARMRGLGLIKFIGELYKIDMLNDSIMLECIVRLIADTSEESLECLCDLLKTIGKKLEDSLKSSKSEADIKTSVKHNRKNISMADVVKNDRTPELDQFGKFDFAFNQLSKLRKNKESLSSRIRFKIQDTIDLRSQDWAPRRTAESNPKLLQDIRREAEEEEQRRANLVVPKGKDIKPKLGQSGSQSSFSNNSSGLGNSNSRSMLNQDLIKSHQDDAAKFVSLKSNLSLSGTDDKLTLKPQNFWSKKSAPATPSQANTNSTPAPATSVAPANATDST